MLGGNWTWAHRSCPQPKPDPAVKPIRITQKTKISMFFDLARIAKAKETLKNPSHGQRAIYSTGVLS
jgi:hypothetical protein